MPGLVNSKQLIAQVLIVILLLFSTEIDADALPVDKNPKHFCFLFVSHIPAVVFTRHFFLWCLSNNNSDTRKTALLVLWELWEQKQQINVCQVVTDDTKTAPC